MPKVSELTPEQYAKLRESWRQQRAKYRERRQAYQKLWREKNREHRRQYQRLWEEKNREHVREYVRVYQAQRRKSKRLAERAKADNGLLKGLLSNSLYASIQGLVSRSVPPDVRDDIIMAALVLLLENKETDVRAAYARARKEHYRMFSRYQRSLDEPVPGRTGVLRVDMVPSDIKLWI